MNNKKSIKIWFTDFWHPEDEYSIRNLNPIYRLLNKYWDVTLTTKPDFLIYSSFGCEYLKHDCMRIYYTGENMRPNFSFTDYAFSFDYPTNDRNYRLPFYRFHPDYEKIKLPRAKPIDFNLRRFCCFLVSNERASERIEMFNLLSQYKKVDSGGKVLNNVGYRVPSDQKEKLAWMQNYKFSIVFENSEYPGYTTEKLFDGLQANTIPIYWGNPLVVKDFNTRAFINCHDYSDFQAVVEEVKRIDADPNLQLSYLNEPYLPGDQESENCREENIVQRFSTIFESDKIYVSPFTKRMQIIHYPIKMGKRYALKLIQSVKKLPWRIGGKIKKVIKRRFK
ncbi:MAG: glycosyltransferase family 10 [Anaerolineaceae bacterium]